MRCFACNRDTSDGAYVLVRYEYITVRYCDDCYARDDVEIPLDYTEPDPNLEGQPEFNGAFG